MAKIILSGSVAFDRIMDYPGLFADHIIADKAHSINLAFNVDKLSVEFGGTAGNVAYSLALLGEQPEVIAPVGNDFSSYRTHLRLSGVDPKTIHETSADVTASAYILTDRGDNQIAAFHFGAGAWPYDTPVDTNGRLMGLISAGCIADMTMLPIHYRQNKLRYMYDPGQAIPALTDEQLRDGITGAFLVFASDYEMALINEKTGLTDIGILELAENLIVTYGKEGSRLITREKDWRILPAPVKQAVDPTGAGDAYRAGFLKGMALNVPLTTCAQLGSTVAAFAVEQYGTQTHKFSLQEVADRFYAVFGERLPLS